MLNEEDWDDMFCEIEEQGFKSDPEYNFAGEPEDDVEIFFMLLSGL